MEFDQRNSIMEFDRGIGLCSSSCSVIMKFNHGVDHEVLVMEFDHGV